MSISTSERYGLLVQTVVTLLEARNPFNVDHCSLVAHYADATAVEAGLDEVARERLRLAARLHTLGVLLQIEEKQAHAALPITGLGSDTGREKSTHAREADLLCQILTGVDGLQACAEIIMQRHEWFDGSGSLLGLRGEEIRVEARALAVADAFVDMATPKSHREPLTLQEIMARLRTQAGAQFDPRFVEALARAVLDEEERWGATARSRRLDESRCRHWLNLGHFYRQSGEPEWALRSYRAAERLAHGTDDVPLMLECASGQFGVFCDLGEFERGREALTRVRAKAQETVGPPRNWYQLQWGLLEWHMGNERNAQQIVEGVIAGLDPAQDVAGWAAATAVLSHLALVHHGVHDDTHLRWLGEFMQVVSRHDLLDVLVKNRTQTIPLLLSAMLHDLEPTLARNLLTRMGEPCHGDIRTRLARLHPSHWLEALRDHAGPGPTAVPQSPTRPWLPPAPERAGGVRVLTLGSLRVEVNGKCRSEDDWPTQKAMKLFAYLLYRRGSPVTDQTLMELFWPLADEERARNSLRNAVHQIRSILRDLLGDTAAAAALTRSRRTGTVMLQLEAFLDSEALEEGVRVAATHSAEGRWGEGAAVLKEALSYCRGDFLETVRDDWASGVRTRLAECHLHGLDLLARCHMALGDGEAAEMVARQMLARDDLQEAAHANLVEALAMQGRRTDALRHYQAAVVHFKREIGLDAPARLTALYEKYLR